MMRPEQQSIQTICPKAWGEFVEWCGLKGNEKAKVLMFNQNDFRVQIGFYIGFFMQISKSSNEIKKEIMSHSLIDPLDVQKNTVYSLFVKLEARLKHD